ncbi:hypothetical protein [Streptomyces sp. NPDC093568]|uniref:hypothetical protein n=1 Tax=Streptomyces sp. NPDC093568 TaxID=3366041 RepID=UPI0038242492
MLMNDMGDDTDARTDERTRVNITIGAGMLNGLMLLAGLFSAALPRLLGAVLAAVALVGGWLAVRGHRRRNAKLGLIACALPAGCLLVLLVISKIINS